MRSSGLDRHRRTALNSRETSSVPRDAAGALRNWRQSAIGAATSCVAPVNCSTPRCRATTNFTVSLAPGSETRSAAQRDDYQVTPRACTPHQTAGRSSPRVAGPPTSPRTRGARGRIGRRQDARRRTRSLARAGAAVPRPRRWSRCGGARTAAQRRPARRRGELCKIRVAGRTLSRVRRTRPGGSPLR